jgi:hypothetical protein
VTGQGAVERGGGAEELCSGAAEAAHLVDFQVGGLGAGDEGVGEFSGGEDLSGEVGLRGVGGFEGGDFLELAGDAGLRQAVVELGGGGGRAAMVAAIRSGLRR